MRWACALLLLAGGRAETRVVIEDFATTTGLWTDTGEVLGLPESIQPSVGTIYLTNESETHSSLASARPALSRGIQTNSSLASEVSSARPVLSRATTWRTSAPRLANEDSKQDLNV